MPTQGFLLATCGSCKREIRIDRSLAGKQAACPHCRAMLKVPATASEVPDRLFGKQVGGCRLGPRLGAGALGVVYEAEDLTTGGTVAIKLLSSKAATEDEVVTRFVREAELAETIRHPHLVEVRRHGHERGVHWMVMELVAGGTLANLVESAPLPWREAIDLVRQAAQAVAHLHQRGILHRDIKPANILWSGGVGGTPKIAKLSDLGLAKQTGSADDPAAGGLGLTMQGVALGSPAYMPAEQILDTRSVGPSADVYALGVTLYNLVSARLPYEGRSGTEVMQLVLEGSPVPVGERVAGLPVGVCDLITRCLVKDRSQRPQDGAALVAAIDTALAHPDQPLAPLAVAPRPPPAGRGPWLWVGIVVVVAVLAAFYLLLFRASAAPVQSSSPPAAR